MDVSPVGVTGCGAIMKRGQAGNGSGRSRLASRSKPLCLRPGAAANLWHRRHQSLRVFVARTGQDLLGGSGFHDLSFVQDRNPVADARHRREIVGDVKNRHSGTAVQFAKQRQNLGLRNHVESAGGLIGNQQRADDASPPSQSARAAPGLRSSAEGYFRRNSSLEGKLTLSRAARIAALAIGLRSRSVRPPGFLQLGPNLQRRDSATTADFAAPGPIFVRAGHATPAR